MSLRNRVPCSALYLKSNWEKYGGYDPIMADGLEDWDFWLNFVEDNKVFYKIKETLFFYRIRKPSRNSEISKRTHRKLRHVVRHKHHKLYGLPFKLRFVCFMIQRFLFQKKITKSGKTMIKIFTIPILIQRFKE